jgi:hypothetical protein
MRYPQSPSPNSPLLRSPRPSKQEPVEQNDRQNHYSDRQQPVDSEVFEIDQDASKVSVHACFPFYTLPSTTATTARAMPISQYSAPGSNLIPTSVRMMRSCIGTLAPERSPVVRGRDC